MATFITGDIHGSHSIRKLARRKFDPTGLIRDDYVVILGDFGLVWSDPPSGEDRYWLDWLEERPWTTLFIDGNHENHDLLAAMPEEEWHGGRVHRVRDHVLHLMRGYVFDIDGRSVFAMGGARSNDIEYRKEGKSWWPNEIPSVEERERALASLDAAGWKVDLVFTHQPPAYVMSIAAHRGERFRRAADEYALWLQECVSDKLDYGMWYSGHMHLDQRYAERLVGLYHSVVRVTDDPLGYVSAG